MIILQQGQFGRAIATCSRNKNLTGSVTFLWTMRHKLSNQSWQFIPYRDPSITFGYEPAYDMFDININLSQPENYIGTSSSNCVNLHFIPGEYYLKIYEQVSTTNLNPALSYDYVYEGMVVIKSEDPIQEISYSGTNDVFIVYQN
jgi:hypothetical protein